MTSAPLCIASESIAPLPLYAYAPSFASTTFIGVVVEVIGSQKKRKKGETEREMRRGGGGGGGEELHHQMSDAQFVSGCAWWARAG